jgi:hypothetical protein
MRPYTKEEEEGAVGVPIGMDRATWEATIEVRLAHGP